jgi:hypothetical protein
MIVAKSPFHSNYDYFQKPPDVGRIGRDRNLSAMAWLHQLAMKRRDSMDTESTVRGYSLFYCTVWITEAELLAMFESP